MKPSKISKIRSTAQAIFFLALLSTLGWYLATKEDLKDTIGTLALSVAWIVILAAAVAILARWRQQFRAPRIYPFHNATGEKDSKEKFDAYALNFTDLLQLELQHINQLLSLPESTAGQRGVAPGAPRPIVSIPYSISPSGARTRGKTALTGVQVEAPRLAAAIPVVPVAIRGEEELSETLKGVGALSLGAVSLPLGALLSLISRAFEGGGITGSLQKYGLVITVVASYENRKWEVQSNWLPTGIQATEESILRQLAHQLALMMLSEFGEHTTAHWQCFREWIEGLESYHLYWKSGCNNLRALQNAQKQFEKAIAFDDQFGWAYYTLGLVYDEQGLVDSACEMYRLAVQKKSDLREALFRWGEALFARDQRSEAVDVVRRAVEQAEKVGKPFPLARLRLGEWLISLAASLAESDDPRQPYAFIRESLQQFRLSGKEFRRFSRRARLSQRESGQTQSFLRTCRVQALKGLSQAYVDLAFTFEANPRAFRLAGARAKWARRGAEKALKASLAFCPDDAEIHALLGSYYLRQGKFKLAEKSLKIARTIDPQDTTLQLDIGALYLDPAYEDVFHLIDTFKKDPKVWRSEWTEDRFNAVFDQLAVASLYYRNALYLTQQKSDSEDGSVDDNVRALVGLSNVYGARAILSFYHALAYQNGSVQDDFHDSLYFARKLLGKALVLDPFGVSIYDGLSAVYSIEASLRRELGEPETSPAKGKRAMARLGSTALLGDMTPLSDLERIADAYQGVSKMRLDDSQSVLILSSLALSTDKQRAKNKLLDPAIAAEKWEEFLDQAEPSWVTQVLLWSAGWILVFTGKEEVGARFLMKALSMGRLYEADLVDYELGRLYQVLAYWKEAEDYYLLVGQDDPYYWQSRTALIEVAQAKSEARLSRRHDGPEENPDLESAYTEATQAAGADPYRRAWALAGRADQYRSEKRYEPAIRDCNEALSLVPGYTYPYVILAFIYMELPDFDRAIECWQRMGELTPHEDTTLFHLGLGDAYVSKAAYANDPQKTQWLEIAAEEYHKAILLYKPEEIGEEAAIYGVLADTLIELKKFKEAGLAYQSALVLAKDAPEAHNLHMQLAYVFVKTGQYGLARDEYQKAIRFCEEQLKLSKRDKSKVAMYSAGLAQACNLLAYYVHAERGIELEEGLALVNRALDVLEKAKYDQAILNENRGAYLDTRGWIYFKQGKYDQARADIEGALSLTMGTVYEHSHLAVIYLYLAEACVDEAEARSLRAKAQEQKYMALELDREGVWENLEKMYFNR